MRRVFHRGQFKVRLRHRDIPRARLLADLRRIARANRGRSLTMAIYSKQGRFRAQTLCRRFGSWTAALRAARLPVAHLWGVPDDVLFANLAEVWRQLGRQPTCREMTKHDGRSRFAGSTYKARFGSWHKALLAFEVFINRQEGAPPLPVRDRGGRRQTRDIGWRLRATVLIRDNCLCRMCGASPAKDPAVTLHVDHIEPWSKGGRTTLANLQTLCAVCNIGKGAGPAATAAPASSTSRSPARPGSRSPRVSRSPADDPRARGSG